MKNRSYLPILAVALIGTCCLGGDRPLVLAHYMPWFKAEALPDGTTEWDHWQWFGKGPKHDPETTLENGRRDIAAVFYPLIGPYDGRDPAVLEYHLLSAKAAGIEGFVADWYGPGSDTDGTFAELVKAAERYDMKVAICLEEKSFFPGYSKAQTREEVVGVMETHIRHVLDTHAKSGAYLRIQGRPAFFIFNGWGDSSIGPIYLSPEEQAAALGRFGPDELFYVRGDINPDYMTVAPGSYAWIGDAAAREKYNAAAQAARKDGRIQFWAGVANPGFDDTGVHGWGGGPRVVDRRGTQEYEDNWNEILRCRPDAVQIATWNDFQEGTTIEPAIEYGFEFLDLTEEYVAGYTGRKESFRDNRWPFRLLKLRRAVADLADDDARADWTGKLDAFSAAFVRGERFFMGFKLWRLEKQIGRSSGKQRDIGDGADGAAPSMEGFAPSKPAAPGEERGTR